VAGQADPGQSAFVEDMVYWMQFQASVSTAQPEPQHGPPLPQDDPGGGGGTLYDQQLALMSDVGESLLEHCLKCGMPAVAGANQAL